MNKISFLPFFFVILVHNFMTIVPQNYSASNPAFVNFSKISRDTLESNFGTIVYSVVIIRHGDGTPIASYPKDPYRNYPWPQGYMQLTNQGKLRLNKIGQYFKGRYTPLTGISYNYTKANATSSDLDINLQSAECFFSGYFPPTPSEIWDRYIFWQPVPVYTIPEEYDNIYDFTVKCPLYDRLEKQFYKINPTVKYICEKYKNFFSYIEDKTGESLFPCSESTFTKLRLLQNTLFTQKTQFNLKLPKWTNSVFPEPLTSLVGQTYKLASNELNISRLQCGLFYEKLLFNLEQITNDSNSVCPLQLYFLSETTIIPYMRAINIYNNHLLPYGASLMFELRKKVYDYYITVLYTNSTESNPYLINIPECGTCCTLQKFKNIINVLIPQNWTDECNDSKYF